MIFDDDDYFELNAICFGRSAMLPEGYPGYRPAVLEAPNGDGKIDAQKRFAHVALKYLEKVPASCVRSMLVEYLARAHFEACRVAEALGVPAEFYPRVADGTLRINEYPEGAGSAEHTDFDLFTVLCYRETPEDLELVGTDYATEKWNLSGPVRDRIDAARTIDPRMHIGEIGELVGLGPATPHRVIARPYVQRSIVYFAMPSHSAVLTIPIGSGFERARGVTVGEWLAERIARSRVPAVQP